MILENIDAPIKNITLDSEGRVIDIERGTTYTIEQGERFAQLRLVEAPAMNFIAVGKINEKTERGDGAYGSSGKK